MSLKIFVILTDSRKRFIEDFSPVLSQFGLDVIQNGSPEYLLINSIPDKGITSENLRQKLGYDIFKSGFAMAMRNN